MLGGSDFHEGLRRSNELSPGNLRAGWAPPPHWPAPRAGRGTARFVDDRSELGAAQPVVENLGFKTTMSTPVPTLFLREPSCHLLPQLLPPGSAADPGRAGLWRRPMPLFNLQHRQRGLSGRGFSGLRPHGYSLGSCAVTDTHPDLVSRSQASSLGARRPGCGPRARWSAPSLVLLGLRAEAWPL